MIGLGLVTNLKRVETIGLIFWRHGIVNCFHAKIAFEELRADCD